MYTFAKFSLALVTFHGLMGNNISAIPHRLNKANKSYFYPGQMEFFAPCCLQPRAAIKSTRTTIVLYLRFIRTRFKLYHYYPTYFASNKFPSLSNIPLLPPPPLQDITAQISLPDRLKPSIDPRSPRHALDETQFHRAKPSSLNPLSREIHRYNGHSRNRRLCMCIIASTINAGRILLNPAYNSLISTST